MGTTNFDVVQANAFIGGILPINPFGDVWYVDGSNGGDANSGKSPQTQAFATIAKAISVASAGDTIIIAPKTMAAGATDPASYAEALTIPAAKHSLTLIGVGGRAQGGLPQIKKGSGTAALITIRAPGCRILNLGFNGAGSTGGGILLDDDASTKTAFGTEIANCHFKNCKGATATDGRTGGAIQWAAAGGAWQVWIHNNRFYKNVCDVLLKGTTSSRPQDVVIEKCDFSGPAASVDVNLYLAGGSGMNGVIIRDCTFPELPAIGSGSVVRYVDLTGCVGMMANNFFGSLTADTGTTITFIAAGTGGKVPTTVKMAGNFGMTDTDSESAEIAY